jgi:hypothetical protein
LRIGSEPVVWLGAKKSSLSQKRSKFLSQHSCATRNNPVAGPVGKGEELHRLVGDLVMSALLDNEAARDDGFAGVPAQFVNGAAGVPSDIGIQFQRMPACIRAREKLRTDFRDGFGFDFVKGTAQVAGSILLAV